MRSFPRSIAALALLSGNLLGQAGGFSDGEMFLYTRAATGSTSADGGLISVDPTNGDTSLMFGFDYVSNRTGAAAFDSFRKRIVFTAGMPNPSGPGFFSLYTTDAAGNVETMIHPSKVYSGISPTGDGRIYLLDAFDPQAPYRWLDGANRIHKLYDTNGTTPFYTPGVFNHTKSAMTYDPVTNALFIAVTTAYGASCNGGSNSDITIRKIPLSAEGTRVGGPVACQSVDVDLNQGTEVPVNWSRGPGGSLLLVVDNVNLTYDFARMLKVEPSTFAISPFAINGGYLGAADGTAGAYSSALGKAVLVDTRNDVMRAFASGETGAGTVITPSGPLSWNPGYGELGTMLEVDNGACGGGVQAFGAGLKGTGNVVPALTASGCAALGGALNLHLADVLGGASGFLMIGLDEADLAYQGGSLYVSPILILAIPVGGAPGVAGSGAVDLSFGTLTDPAIAGLSIIAQAGFLDAGAIQGSSLTQGLRLEIN